MCIEEAANGVKRSHLPAGQGEQGISHEHLGVVGNGISNDSGSDGGEEGVEQLPSLAARGSLTDEVFNNLPEDLQELLRSASSSCKWGCGRECMVVVRWLNWSS